MSLDNGGRGAPEGQSLPRASRCGTTNRRLWPLLHRPLSPSSSQGQPRAGRWLSSQDAVSLASEELAVAQDSSWGPRLRRVCLRAQQSQLRSSDETLLLKEA